MYYINETVNMHYFEANIETSVKYIPPNSTLVVLLNTIVNVKRCTAAVIIIVIVVVGIAIQVKPLET